MKWSFKIGEVFGISIKVHASFLLVLLLFGGSNATSGGLAAGILTVLFLLTIFFFVLLHELGHSVAAMRYGVKVKDIVLLPIGGVARMEQLPKNPVQEIIIALAGPAVNFATVAILFLLMSVTGQPIDFMRFDLSGRDLWNSLMSLNFFMGTFNLIPAFPMDGGRVLRGLLALRFGYGQSTKYASMVGQVFAVLFAVVGFFGLPGVWDSNWWLILIAVFIFMGAGSENQLVNLQEAIDDVPVEQVMSTRVYTLAPHDPLRKALAQTYQGAQDDFPILDGERLVGIVSKHKIIESIRQAGTEAPVKHFMATKFFAVRPFAKLANVYQEMISRGIKSVPVVQGDRLVGMLTRENIGRYFVVKSKLGSQSFRDSQQTLAKDRGRSQQA